MQGLLFVGIKKPQQNCRGPIESNWFGYDENGITIYQLLH